MQIVYARKPFPEQWSASIFLAGPTPRDVDTPSWRPDVIRIIEQSGFDGVVMVPEDPDGQWGSGPDAYLAQVEWEKQGLEMADIVLFWVPREMQHMPALTTNVEFGRYITSGKVVLGAPENAKSIKYLEWMLKDVQGPAAVRYLTMEGTVDAALTQIEKTRLNHDELRTGGERMVPLHIWSLPSFQEWYQAQTIEAGNRLDDARLLWHFKPPKARVPFAWVLWVKVWIASEERYKENEFVFARSDISAVVLYSHGATAFDTVEWVTSTEVVIVREFRSPARTVDGFIREMAGGSSLKPGQNPLAVASDEVHEETGLLIAPERFRPIGDRQVAGTLSAHHAVVFAVELSAGEMTQAKALAAADEVHGVEADSERTYVQVVTLRDLLAEPITDWATIGMVTTALLDM